MNPTQDLTEWHFERFNAAQLDTIGLKNLPEPRPLIEGVLQLDSTAECYGPSGIGKTFLLVSMACSIATGTPWMGHDVAEGPVLYVIAENASGTGARVEAWEEHHGTTIPPRRITWLPLAVNLGEQTEVDAFARIVEDVQPVLIVFDTRARCTVGVEENSARDIGLVVARLDELRRRSKACVLTVHHPAASGEKARGSTALLGAVDTELRLERAGDGMRLKLAKQRNAPDSLTVTLARQPVGRSIVVVPGDPVRVEGGWDDLILDQLGELCRGGELTFRGAWAEAVAEACTEAGREPPSDSSVKRAIARLVEEGSVERVGRGQYRPAPIAPVLDLGQRGRP